MITAIITGLGTITNLTISKVDQHYNVIFDCGQPSAAEVTVEVIDHGKHFFKDFEFNGNSKYVLWQRAGLRVDQ